MNREETKSIVTALQNKDKMTQKIIFENYHPLFLGVCLRYCHDKSEAEDILLEGFMNIFTRIDSYNYKGSFEGWMRRIVVNTAIDNFRKNQKHYFHQDSDEHSFEIIDWEDLEANMNAQDLMRLLQELPQGYRMVFNLFSIEGYSHKEIGKMLKISENTSKTQLKKARAVLQKKLKKIYEQIA